NPPWTHSSGSLRAIPEGGVRITRRSDPRKREISVGPREVGSTRPSARRGLGWRALRWEHERAIPGPCSGLELPRFGGHYALFCVGPVVVADQVEEAVREQHGHLVEDAPLLARGLSGRRLERNDDVPQHLGPRRPGTDARRPARSGLAVLTHRE